MIQFLALVLVAGLQLAFIALTLILLFVTRLRGALSAARQRDAAIALSPSLRRVMLGDDRGESLAEAFSRLRPEVAAGELIAIGGSRLSAEQMQSVALLVRGSDWVERTLKHASSRKWWKRMEAARLLAMVGRPGDERILARLVTDDHPAVAGASTAAIAGRADAALVETVVRGLPERSPSVRLQQAKALRSHSDPATQVVVRLLAHPASPHELRSWLQLAEILGTPAALAAAVPLTRHPDSGVRTSAARALRSCFLSEAVDAVTHLLRDENWRVRAAAARATGALNAVGAIPLLAEAMRDDSWWVRFRAALALAELSEEGRSALEAAQRSNDRYARDMATLVCGLSTGSRLELTSA